jgi:bifunctional DNA-binding transcriptional regulator/antitoxin component of YhaV-PrlF toxin-antitoxin module
MGQGDELRRDSKTVDLQLRPNAILSTITYSIMEQVQEHICDEAGPVETTVRVRLGESGRLVLPPWVRKVMGARAGDWMFVQVVEGESGQELRIATAKQQLSAAIRQVRAVLPEGVNAVEELMEERRQEAQREATGTAWAG